MLGKATAWATTFSIPSLSDIDSLELYAGVHAQAFGYHRLLGKRFPFAVYYKMSGDVCVVWRVLDCRQNPAKIAGALKQSR